MVMLVDSHCHLQEIKHYAIKDVLPVVCGYSHPSNIKAAEMAKKSNLPFCLGIAPQSVIKLPDLAQLDEWIDYIKKQKPNAIGECGLDYHWAKEKKEIEREEITFYRMIELAEETRLPLVIHARQAMRDVIDALRIKNFGNRVMFHFFSGKMADAERAISNNSLISITPLHSKERREIIGKTPLENLVVETDAPYVGRTPDDVRQAIAYIAEIKKLDFEIVASQTARNALEFLNFTIG